MQLISTGNDSNIADVMLPTVCFKGWNSKYELYKYELNRSNRQYMRGHTSLNNEKLNRDKVVNLFFVPVHRKLNCTQRSWNNDLFNNMTSLRIILIITSANKTAAK